MKKRAIITLLLLVLSVFVFISCSDEATPMPENKIGRITLGGDNSRAIGTSVTYTSDVEDLYWYYKATKKDDGYTTGQTSGYVAVAVDSGNNPVAGLSGKTLNSDGFSYGYWDIELKGYSTADSATESNAKYTASLNNFLVEKEMNYATVEIKVGDGAETKIEFGDIWFSSDNITTSSEFKLTINDTDGADEPTSKGTVTVNANTEGVTTNVVVEEDKVTFKNITYTPGADITGDHVMTFTLVQILKATGDTSKTTDINVALYTLKFSVLEGTKTTISGDMLKNDTTGGIQINGSQSVSSTTLRKVIPVTDTATEATAVVKTTTSISVGDLTVTYPKDAVIVPGTNGLAGTASADGITSDGSIGFEYKDDGVPTVEGITIETGESSARYELTLNASEDNTNPNTTLIIVKKYLGLNLDITKIYHGTTALTEYEGGTFAENTEYYSYDASTGYLTLYVFHASDFYIITKAPETYVAQVGSTKYTDAVAAFNAAKETNDKVIILADCSVERDKLPNGVEFDLNGHTISESYTDYVMSPSSTLNGDNIYINMWLASYYAYWSTDQNGNYCPEYLLVTDSTSYTYNGSSSVASVLAGKLSESNTNPYAFIYKLTETEKTRVINNFDGDSTALKYFTGGRGIENDPFQISSSEDWRNLCYFDPDGWDNYFILNNDIDFNNSLPRGYTLVDFYIDGNGKKIKNVAGPLFDQKWIYAELHIKDLTFEYCNSEFSLISWYGIYNGYKSYNKNLISTFKNVDVVSSTCKEGAFFYPYVYTESGETTTNYSITFTDCDISNSTLNDNIGSQGYVAAFVANSKDFVTLTNCTLLNTAISASANAAGMLGTNGKIDSCHIDDKTTIKQSSTLSSVAAMAGSATIENSKCYIIIAAPSTSQINKNGFETVVTNVDDLGFSGDNFEISENGDITYKGSKAIDKLKIIQRVNLNRLSNGTFINGGFPTYFDTDEHEFSSIFDSSDTNTTLLNAVKYVKAVYNVTDESNITNVLDCVASTLPTGLSYNSEGFAYNDGTLYLNANQGNSTWSSYFAGTHKELDKTVTTLTVTVYFSAYDNSNELLGTVTKGYTVTLNKNN